MTPGAGASERQPARSRTPSAQARHAPPKPVQASARAPRLNGGTQSIGRPAAGDIPRVSIASRTRVEGERHNERSGVDVRNPIGNSPDEAAPPAGGVSSAAVLLSLAVVLIPLVGWVFEHAAAGAPRHFFVSFLERPG
jgi:hypothetical protein